MGGAGTLRQKMYSDPFFPFVLIRMPARHSPGFGHAGVVLMSHRRSGLFLFVAVLAVATACQAPPEEPPSTESSGYLFAWSGDADQEDSDFLAVIDARATSPDYGQVVATLPVGATGTMPHHLQYEFPDNKLLFANGWKAGRTFVIDVADPLKPTIKTGFTDLAGYSFPHSFAPLPGERMLGTFQTTNGGQVPPGGLVELGTDGVAIRAVSSRTEEIDDALNWPYSLITYPGIGRAISTSADMGFPPMDEWEYHYTYHVQIWDLDSLALLHNVALPASGDNEYHYAPAEPRLLADGSVYVSTFGCGLFRLEGLQGDAPSATFVHAFPGSLQPGEECFVPVVVGNYWIQTVLALPGLVVLDVSDSRAPREVGRLVLDVGRYPAPHWIAADRAGSRLVVTGNNKPWMLVINIDNATGELTVDESFRDAGAEHAGVTFGRDTWPHGETGAAWVHGVLFGH